MNKFKYSKISNTKKIRYLTNYYKKNLYIVFLHGFMSDLEGKKPKAFQRYCKKRKLGFLSLEYSGHGKSSGKFTKGNISKWTKEIKYTIKKIVKKNNFIIMLKITILGATTNNNVTLKMEPSYTSHNHV